MNEHQVRRTAVVKNPQGLHARPADLIAKLARTFGARVELIRGADRVDGKSMLNIMMLGAAEGSVIEIEAIGADANEALAAVGDMIEQIFAEDE